MNLRAALLALVSVVAVGCSKARPADSPESHGAPTVVGGSQARKPPNPVEATIGTARCRGVGEGAALLAGADEILTRALLDGTALPVGWTATSSASAPAPNDPLFLVAASAWHPFCASTRTYQAPSGSVKVLVVVLADENAAIDASGRMNSARGPDTSPAIIARRHVTLIQPGDTATASAWAAAGNQKSGVTELDKLARAAEIGGAAMFFPLFEAHVAGNPSDGMPWAYRAAVEAKSSRFADAKSSAQQALRLAGEDAEVRAEALHWAAYAEYASGGSNATVRELAGRGVEAARTSGNEAMLMRALFGHACSLSVGGDVQGALAAVKESLAIESKLGGNYYKDAARTDPDLAAVRKVPEMMKLLAE